MKGEKKGTKWDHHMGVYKLEFWKNFTKKRKK